MLFTVHLDISREDGYIIVEAMNSNILRLYLKHEVYGGQHGGDKIEIRITDEACTIWETTVQPDGVKIVVDGYSEVYTFCILLRCAAEAIELRHMGMSEDELFEFLKTDFSRRYGWNTPKDF
ncbi:hypothetical protein [Polluticoccus soli]|uniref:hypothetical protein n=1 Tax=Polluticoccus soli TaxID=3034150 RepID=UPI0023E2E310|nr:hypothetical protein [Flavipsychrobacter sp. JY13-12]